LYFNSKKTVTPLEGNNLIYLVKLLLYPALSTVKAWAAVTGGDHLFFNAPGTFFMEQENTNSNRFTRISSRYPNLIGRGRGFLQFSAGVLVVLLAIALYNRFTPEPDRLTDSDVRETVLQVLASATPPPAFSNQVYQIIHPSLVLIQTHGEAVNGEQNDSLGSGVVVNDRGDILTSLHVVAGAEDIEVVYADGTRAKAFVIATQPENDIAVLGSDELPEVLIPAVLGNPNAMQVGDEAFAVGNPFGLYGSVSAGVISGFGRSFQPEDSGPKLENLIQIDAAVNPGNSGGPLLNRSGQVVGIVVGIVNPTDMKFFIGIGFAVPIDIAGSAAGIPPY
jgi:S1-C subfamily serine protease